MESLDYYPRLSKEASMRKSRKGTQKYRALGCMEGDSRNHITVTRQLSITKNAPCQETRNYGNHARTKRRDGQSFFCTRTQVRRLRTGTARHRKVTTPSYPADLNRNGNRQPNSEEKLHDTLVLESTHTSIAIRGYSRDCFLPRYDTHSSDNI